MENVFLLVFWSIILFCAVIRTAYSVKSFYKKDPKLTQESIDTDLARMMLDENFVTKVNLLIDSIIKEHAEVYQVMVLSINEEGAQYITTEQQDEMQKYVLHMVMKNISPELRSIIKLVYNIDDAKDLRDMISIRVKLYLINFIVEYNKEFTE